MKSLSFNLFWLKTIQMSICLWPLTTSLGLLQTGVVSSWTKKFASQVIQIEGVFKSQKEEMKAIFRKKAQIIFVS